MITSDFDTAGIAVGDQVNVTISWTDFWNNLGLNEYNKAARENSWPEWTQIKIDELD